MNAVSAVFTNPDDPTDIKMVDFLEAEVPGGHELVEQIRQARNGDVARQLVAELWKKMDADPSTQYPPRMEEWLQSCMRLRGREEMAGPHHIQSEGIAGALPPGVGRRGDGQRA